MADLLRFVSRDLRSGSRFDLYYLNRFPKIGDGSIATLVPLHLSLSGSGQFFIWPFRMKIDLKMPDLRDEGECTIEFDGGALETVKYRVADNRLNIAFKDLQFYADGNWTWVWVNHDGRAAWVGMWPQGRELPENVRTAPRHRPDGRTRSD